MRILCLDDEPLALKMLEEAVRESKPDAVISGFRKQAELLEEAEKKRAQREGGQDSGSGEPQQKRQPIKRSYVKASQICRAQKIRNIEELNRYVDGIRNNLIAALGDNDEIIVS